ncbi:MAG TPA: hypothetical protein PKY35_09410 [Candidatus Hydrogenedentes bacterium]|nr:hypothetical protein [Candidatus Hydrogenedentota bacterium]HOL77235.1 hypothetical protein [Candidatus Hydrogenedentota bacterium]HPO86524.1 hypothetical protein [Candidatus Hydrogenedentota bacterium]
MKETSGGCSCCRLSRRCFLAMASAAAISPLATAEQRGRTSNTFLRGALNPTAYRPKPKVQVRVASLRLPPPYWLGWPGASYDVEKHYDEYNRSLCQAANRAGVTLLQEDKPIENDQGLDAFVSDLGVRKPDAVCLVLQHFGVWHWAEAVTKLGIPTIIFAPIGTAFTGHVHDISRRSGVYVISSLDTGALNQALRMVRAKRQFEESRLLVVAGAERKEDVLERLGTRVRYVPRSELPNLFDATPVTDEVKQIARDMRKKAEKIVEPSREDLINAARSFVAALRLIEKEEANAVTTDCLGMVAERHVPTPPCMAASLFQDAGITYGCEADVFGAISLMLTSYLFDKPGFMNDPVPETVKNVLIAAHCVCGTRLNGFEEPPVPFILRSHAESNLGVSLQVLWREGQPVTLVRFQNPNQVIVDTGTVVGNVSTPPAGGCRTSVEIKMDDVEDVRNVLGFHQVVFYGNHRRDVEAFCQLYGIETIHSPKAATA